MKIKNVYYNARMQVAA